MAVSQIGMTDFGDKREFIGLSTDDKPLASTTDGVSYRIGSGSTFYEVDTKATYIYDAKNINTGITDNNWWAK